MGDEADYAIEQEIYGPGPIHREIQKQQKKSRHEALMKKHAKNREKKAKRKARRQASTAKESE